MSNNKFRQVNSKNNETSEGYETIGMFIHSQTLGNSASDILVIDAGQGAVMAGPVTLNCTLTVNGTLTIV